MACIQAHHIYSTILTHFRRLRAGQGQFTSLGASPLDYQFTGLISPKPLTSVSTDPVFQMVHNVIILHTGAVPKGYGSGIGLLPIATRTRTHAQLNFTWLELKQLHHWWCDRHMMTWPKQLWKDSSSSEAEDVSLTPKAPIRLVQSQLIKLLLCFLFLKKKRSEE